MTLAEWTAATRAALEAAGYAVEDWNGFPLVKRPASFGETLRLLEFQPPLAGTHRTIAAQGMLFTPAPLDELDRLGRQAAGTTPSDAPSSPPSS